MHDALDHEIHAVFRKQHRRVNRDALLSVVPPEITSAIEPAGHRDLAGDQLIFDPIRLLVDPHLHVGVIAGFLGGQFLQSD